MEHQELLTHVYLFRGATSEDLAALASIVERKVVIAGDRVYAEGDDPDAMFLIEMGRVDVGPEQRRTAIVTFGSGQAFGELGFFARGRRSVWRTPASPPTCCASPSINSPSCSTSGRHLP
jgi:CRP-like cAMP-binding protein